MKIMTDKDFDKLDDELMWIEAHYETVINYMNEIATCADDEHIRAHLKNHVEWSKTNGGPSDLKRFRHNLMDRGVYNKGLRF